MRSHAKIGDRFFLLVGIAFAFSSFLRDHRAWQPLGDVKVPNGIYKPLMFFLLVRQRRSDRAIAEFGKVSGKLGTLIGTRMKQGDERGTEMLDLTRSVRRLTVWLVALTIVVGIVGVGSIVTAIAIAS
jgi:hypothetical protein